MQMTKLLHEFFQNIAVEASALTRRHGLLSSNLRPAAGSSTGAPSSWFAAGRPLIFSLGFGRAAQISLLTITLMSRSHRLGKATFGGIKRMGDSECFLPCSK